MATALTSLLGDNLKVGVEPRQMQRVYHAFPGVSGLVAMNMGFRGYAIPIIGQARGTGYATYAAARTGALNVIQSIQNLQLLGPASYTYGNDTFDNAIFESFLVLKDQRGKSLRWSGNGVIVFDFGITLRGLI